MKKIVVFKTILLFFVVACQLLSVQNMYANTVVRQSDVQRYISTIYEKFDFKGSEKLSYEVFENAYRGYLNLLFSGKLNREKQILTVVDFSQSSTQKRMWVLDLKHKKVLVNDYVAHGQGSGEEFATVFSNVENSHQSSLGFYVTGDIYNGDHGASLHLHGVDNGFNTAAFDRAIVIHGADYVCSDFIKSQNRLGRSWGCPAVSNDVVKKLITTVDEGTCLFIYAKDKKYLANSYWLNKKVNFLPEEDMKDGAWAMNTAKPKDTVYVYDISAADFAPKGAKIVSLKAYNAKPSLPIFPFIWKLMP